MRLTRLLVFSGLILMSLKGFTQQFSSQLFHQGYLVTTEEDTIRGNIKYDMETNIVQWEHHDLIKTFSSHNVFYFEIYDKILNTYRQFYSIPYSVQANYKVPIIFELVYEGPLSLLSREAIVQEATNTGYGYGYGYGTNVVTERLKHTYFFLDKKGTITRFDGRKSDLMYIMRDKSSKVKDFIKKNHLRIDDIKDLIRITAFYNAL